jgi:threonyl-tRNA synthetase
LSSLTFFSPYLTPCSSLLAVVGEVEQESQSVNVRNRDDVGTKARSEIIKLDTLSAALLKLKENRSINNKLEL